MIQKCIDPICSNFSPVQPLPCSGVGSAPSVPPSPVPTEPRDPDTFCVPPHGIFGDAGAERSPALGCRCSLGVTRLPASCRRAPAAEASGKAGAGGLAHPLPTEPAGRNGVCGMCWGHPSAAKHGTRYQPRHPAPAPPVFNGHTRSEADMTRFCV